MRISSRAVRHGGLAVLLVVLPIALACSGRSRPPVILVLIDTLRADYVGCYGFDGPVSPAIDAIAKESHLFQRCYSQAPWTKPSVASMFCSLYPGGHRVTNQKHTLWGENALSDRANTLAEILKENAYATAAFVANPWVTAENGYDQGFDVFREFSIPDGPKAPGDSLLAAAGPWLEAHQGDPFFLYLHFMEVHAPYNAPEEHYEPLARLGWVQQDLSSMQFRQIPHQFRNSYWVGEREIKDLGVWRARYAAGMADIDHKLDRFLEGLRSSGVLDRSWLIIASDHGEELYEHRGWGHGRNLYEHQLRVPLLIRPPGGLAEGRTHEGIVRLIDIMPTVLAGLGIPAPPGLDGEDLSPFWKGRGEPAERVSFATAVTTNPGLYSLTVGRYKLIVDVEEDHYRLLDLVRDPGEQILNSSAAVPELARELYDEVLRFAEREGQRPLFEEGEGGISEERLERLRSLGYLN